MKVRINIATVTVTDLGEASAYPADTRMVEVLDLDGKSYYHVQGPFPVGTALRLALRVVEAGQIDLDHWGCFADEQKARQEYYESGQAAYDEEMAEGEYAAHCAYSFQQILAAEHYDPCTAFGE